MKGKIMCKISEVKQVPVMNTQCGCGCICPARLTVEDEIKLLEEHKKLIQDQIEIINQKLVALKSV
jgi:hypothetical protein